MQKNKKVPKRQKGGIILKILLCGFILYSGINLVKLSFDIKDRNETVKVLAAAIESKEQENETLKTAIERGITKEEVIRLSREKLNLVSPGEKVFINIDGQ